jgi:hypothetical protein
MSTNSIQSNSSPIIEKEVEYIKIKIPYEDTLKEQIKSTKDEEMKKILSFPEDNIQIKVNEKEEIKELSVNKTNKKKKVFEEKENKVFDFILEFSRIIQQPEVQIVHKYKDYQKIIYDDSLFIKQKYQIDSKEEEDNLEENEKNENEKEIKVSSKLLSVTYEDAKKKISSKTFHKVFKLLNMSQTTTEFEWDGGTEHTICKKIVASEKKFFE